MAAFPETFEHNPFATHVILVVEDDLDIAQMLKNILEHEGPYRVVLASDAFQALRLMHSVQPDLFVFDYRLPGIDGLDLYQRLHAQEVFANIPVLFLSAYAPTGLFEQEHLAYLSKPFELEDFIRKIDVLLTG